MVGLEETIYTLVLYLCRQDNFKKQLLEIKENQQFTKYSWEVIADSVERSDGFLITSDRHVISQLREYSRKIYQLSNAFHLPLNWGPKAIHKWAFDLARGFGVRTSLLSPVDISDMRVTDNGQLELIVNLRPFARWKDIEELFRNSRRTIMNSLKQLPARNPLKEDPVLERDLSWLARRITTGESYIKIWEWQLSENPDFIEWPNQRRKRKKPYRFDGEATDVSGNVVGAAIRKRASFLGIQL